MEMPQDLLARVFETLITNAIEDGDYSAIAHVGLVCKDGALVASSLSDRNRYARTMKALKCVPPRALWQSRVIIHERSGDRGSRRFHLFDFGRRRWWTNTHDRGVLDANTFVKSVLENNIKTLDIEFELPYTYRITSERADAVKSAWLPFATEAWEQGCTEVHVDVWSIAKRGTVTSRRALILA